MERKENRIKDVVETAIRNLNTITDVNTVIGKEIRTENGEYIIPFSKITVMVLSGGGEYGNTTIFSKNKELPFSAGNGAIVSLKPSGFLIRDKNEEYGMVSADNSYDKALDKITQIIENLNESTKN
ncbi:MAG: sporulation protein YtfJ [Clostridia bacterium]|nr:sporulation protein YtfJ [Clostridia bacterium]